MNHVIHRGLDSLFYSIHKKGVHTWQRYYNYCKKMFFLILYLKNPYLVRFFVFFFYLNLISSLISKERHIQKILRWQRNNDSQICNVYELKMQFEDNLAFPNSCFCRMALLFLILRPLRLLPFCNRFERDCPIKKKLLYKFEICKYFISK